jgi:hypothetical protein
MLPVFAAAALGLGAAHADTPSTYYIRGDGGSAGQCDGLHDAAYAGHGRACAWRHPFEALPPGGPPRIHGGDTLIIGAGSYRMGSGAPGTEALEKCRDTWPWDCHVAAPPSGPSADHPTRLLGAGFDTGCRQPPELWGSGRASAVLELSGSSNVEVGCLDITDHSGCIEFHHAQDLRCQRDKPPYGDWAAIGIEAIDSANVQLHDVAVHGLAHDGIRAGRVRDWTLERVRITGNGWSGWNGDTGGDSSDAGRLAFHDVEIAWNGCGETYPARGHAGCWGQEQGGYGDGLGTGRTGGDWTFDHVHVHHNTQDGIDLLHADASATVSFRNVRAEANAGNQLKSSGSVTMRNSTVNGNCAALADAGLDAADLCRAEGNSVSLYLSAQTRDAVVDNEIDGEGDCLIGFQCSGDGCASAGATVRGNLLAGTARRRTSGEMRAPCAVWIEPELHGAKIDFSHNRLRATRSSRCPDEASTCTDNR